MANQAEEPYQYSLITDIDGIRLIVLQPSPDEAARVQCSLIHTTLRRAREEIHEHYAFFTLF
jgi:hypothetical protein